jgi:hypothetical protein
MAVAADGDSTAVCPATALLQFRRHPARENANAKQIVLLRPWNKGKAECCQLKMLGTGDLVASCSICVTEDGN